MQHVLSDAAVRRPFDPEVVVSTECMITTFQNVYYFADSFVSAKTKLRSVLSLDLQGGPAKVRPTYIFDGNIWL